MRGRALIWKGLRSGEERGADWRGWRDCGGTGKSLTPDGVSYRAARRASGEALSPKVLLRWAKRSTLPGPKMKVPPSWNGSRPSLCWWWPAALARLRLLKLSSRRR
jgi:hypothetical protein